MTLLSDADNAAQIFFSQAGRDELRHRPRCLVPTTSGDWQPVTWGEMAERSERLAAFLMARGIDQDRKVAVLANTRLEWGLAGIATLAARGVLVPVYPTLVGDPLAHILAHSDARVLFVESAEQLRRVLAVWGRLAVETLVTFESLDPSTLFKETGVEPSRLAGRVLSLEQAEGLGLERLTDNPAWVRDRLASVHLDDLGYLIYTSGTTGMPKGVQLSHRNVAVNGADWIALNGPLLHEGDSDVLWLPMSHIFGWGEFALGNQLGFLTYLSNPLQALDHLRDCSPQVFMSVPAYWEKLAERARAASPDPAAQCAALRRLTGGRLSFCLSGGAGLKREVKELFLAAGIFIVEGYGLTECSPTLTMNRVDDFDFDSVGKPFPSVRLKIAADGEILTKGEHIFRGYYKDPFATHAMFDEQGWLKTGDLGRFNERGFVQIIGRKKEILVTAGGKNIPPENIELRFRGEPLISRVIVYGEGKHYLTALVDIDEAAALARLQAEGAAPTGPVRTDPRVRVWVAERIEAINQTLARYETIKRFCITDRPLTLEAGFLTPSLKVKRTEVYARFRPLLEALYDD